MTANNLWGDLPSVEEGVKTPKRILHEQAEILEEKTSGTLRGVVTSRISSQIREERVLELSIVAPLLDNYRVGIAQVRHGPMLFPLTLTDLVDQTRKIASCQDTDDLETHLAAILQSDLVHKIINALLIQCKEESETILAF